MELEQVLTADQETTEAEPETAQNSEESLTPEQITDLRKRAEASSQNFERAKKAEAERKEALEKLKQATADTSGERLSDSDLIFISKTNINEDYIGEVRDWAKFKKISFKEAFKQLKPTLDFRDEEQRSASAIQVKSARGATSKDNNTILADASKGKLPEDEDGIARLVEAEMERKAKAR